MLLLYVTTYIIYYNTCAYCSYLGRGVSNMAIVDVEIPSGFQHVEHTDLDNAIERTDIRGDNAVFYINGVSSSIH